MASSLSSRKANCRMVLNKRPAGTLAQDPEPEKVPQVSADEAIDMFEGLCWHEFQQEDGIMEVIQVLQLQKQLMLRKANKAWGAKESNN